MNEGIRYDADGDVLYVCVGEAVSYATSREDSYIVLRRDADGSIVGLTMMAASEMPFQYWVRQHPLRRRLPAELRRAVDTWLDNHAQKYGVM